MKTIEIDFDVYKELTIRRETEAVTYNDVIRELLKLPKLAQGKNTKLVSSMGWMCDGILFPDGTEFHVNYKGKNYKGIISAGNFIVEGRRATSFSDGAKIVTNTNVNGWRFWQCRFPTESDWHSLEYIRNTSKKLK